MAKKFVRGITDVKTITNQDFDTNNVNDLLSDGEYNYIHRKKGKTEEYHNLTDNIKTVSSDNTELLSVTNNNKTTNTATLHPKHDKQKEQLLESTDETIVISHGKNGTEETTSVDVNFDKVQEKLTAGDGLGIESNEIKIKPKNVSTLPANTGFYNGAFIDGEWENPYASISLNIDGSKYIQLAFRQSVNTPEVIVAKYRFVANNVPTDWKEMVVDSGYISSLLAQKQDTLVAGDGITINGQTISASAPVQGASVSIQNFSTSDFYAYEHVVTIGQQTLTTFSFECYDEITEHVISGELKEELAKFIGRGYSVTNGALSISHEVDVMKLLKSSSDSHIVQQATFTFYGTRDGGGGGEV